jgi:hypothetical protein
MNGHPKIRTPRPFLGPFHIHTVPAMPALPVPPPPTALPVMNTRGAHRALEDQAVLDFLRGDYAPAASHAPSSWCETRPLNGQAPLAPAAPPVALPRAYAIIQYEPSSDRVRWVVGLFADALSAEEYAISHDLPRYDIVPATAVTPGTP